MVKNKNARIYRVKMIYAKNIFKGMQNKLLSNVNGQGSNDWCSSKAEKFEMEELCKQNYRFIDR